MPTLKAPTVPGWGTPRPGPPPEPERISAALMGLLTLPLQAAFILTLASVLAWLGWVTVTYAHRSAPARSSRLT